MATDSPMFNNGCRQVQGDTRFVFRVSKEPDAFYGSVEACRQETTKEFGTYWVHSFPTTARVCQCKSVTVPEPGVRIDAIKKWGGK